MMIFSFLPRELPDKFKIMSIALLPNLGFWAGSIRFMPEYYRWYTRKFSKNFWHELLGRIHLNAMTTRNLVAGFASYLVWEEAIEFRDVLFPYTAYTILLGLYWTYHPVLFRLRWFELSLAHIFLTAGAATLTTTQFWKVSRRAGILMVPFLAYIWYATYLNYMCVASLEDDSFLDS